MAGAGRGEGRGPGVGKLESQIYCIKYTLFCFNVVLWVSIAQIENVVIFSGLFFEFVLGNYFGYRYVNSSLRLEWNYIILFRVAFVL